MKKIISVIILLVLSLSLFACAPNYKGELLNPVSNASDVYDYYEEVFSSKSDILTDDFSYAFSFVEKTTTKDAEKNYFEKITVNGSVNYEDNFLLAELKLDGVWQKKQTTFTIDGKEKAKQKTTESSSLFFDSGYLSSAFIFSKHSLKSETLSYNAEIKTTDENVSFCYEIFSDYIELHGVIQNISLVLTSFLKNQSNVFVYLDGYNMTVVESRETSSSVVEIICDGDEFKKIKLSETFTKSTSSFTTRSLTISICDEAKISKPTDKNEYLSQEEEI